MLFQFSLSKCFMSWYFVLLFKWTQHKVANQPKTQQQIERVSTWATESFLHTTSTIPQEKGTLQSLSCVSVCARLWWYLWPCSSRWPFFAVKILADGRLWSNLLMFLLNYSDILVKRGIPVTWFDYCTLSF